MGIRVGIDVGTTQTKLVAIKDGQAMDYLKIKSKPTDEDIYKIFESFVKKNEIDLNEIENINLTGVGAVDFSGKLGEKEIHYVHEFDADVAGASFASKGEKDFLLISLGTGTTYIHVKDGKYKHLGGLGLGGGSIDGLFHHIIGTNNISEMSSMAKKGDVTKINLLMSDIAGMKFEGLAGDLTASNFAKITNATKEDIAAGIYSLVIENIIQTGSILANNLNIKSIVLIGGLCNSDELKRTVDRFYILYPDMKYIISHRGSYITALGTALL